jgi:SAM-dependent methyltransferase
MSLGERLLARLSREPEAGDYEQPEWELDSSLSLLESRVPDFRARIASRSVVDFGCGAGFQSVALVQAGASRVLGVEANPQTLARARELAEGAGVGDALSFCSRPGGEHAGRFDIVISQNSMEHFPDPLATLQEMSALLAPGGTLIITFGPPWYAPYGSHMHFFTRVPWVNLLFPEKTVLNVRARYRSDGATRYEEVEGGLNRMSLARFESLIARCGLRVSMRRYEAVRGIDALARLPLLRELFVNHVTYVLER